jgi:NAD-dependent dihydropyrimidine dehydrogenase PreA subunit
MYVSADLCNGCGECVSVCPNGALTLQNQRVFIDQELCQACEVCVDSCPQGAILTGEPALTRSEVVKISSAVPVEIVAEPAEPRHSTLRDVALPAIGSALLWTGREIVPRLADLAIDYLDQRIQAPKPDLNDQKIQMRAQQSSGQRRKGRRYRRQQRRKNRRRSL